MNTFRDIFGNTIKMTVDFGTARVRNKPALEEFIYGSMSQFLCDAFSADLRSDNVNCDIHFYQSIWGDRTWHTCRVTVAAGNWLELHAEREDPRPKRSFEKTLYDLRKQLVAEHDLILRTEGENYKKAV